MRRIVASNVAVSRRMSRTRGHDNPREVALRSILHRRGLRFRIHLELIPGSRRSADIVFPRQRVAVFLDGCFWHGCPLHGTWPKVNAEWWRAKIETNKLRDRDTDDRLAATRWTVVRVWEHESLGAAAHRIATVVGATTPTQERFEGATQAARRESNCDPSGKTMDHSGV
jgi:DNA mismatch endonuclease (patch repair protein)